MDNTRAVEQRAISSMVEGLETKEKLFRTIETSNAAGSISPDGTIENSKNWNEGA